MAFGDYDSSPALKNDIHSSNAFSGIVIPANGWQLEILNMPVATSYREVEALFAKYGNLERIAFIYKMKENSVNCYLCYEKDSDSDKAMNENGKKFGASVINVIRFVNREDKGNKRPRTEDSDWCSTPAPTSNGWGSTPSKDGEWGSSETTSPFGGSRGQGNGRGSARSGGAGGNSRACFKCGEEGHMSRECPKGGSSGGGNRACFRCGEEGHMSRECPKGGGKGCFNCGEEGHMSRECSKPRNGRGRGRGGGANMGTRRPDSSSTSDWGSSETSTPLGNDSWD